MTVLIYGSLAYDTIASFEGRFNDFIIASEASHLNLTFPARECRDEFGGCAGNIAWSMSLLGGSPRILSSLGRDGGRYLERLRTGGADISSIAVMKDIGTARAFITTDSGGNQLTTFCPGAMDEASAWSGADFRGASLCHIAPGGTRGMTSLGEECRRRGIPVVFDPGQSVSQLSVGELSALVGASFLVCLSQYEESLLLKRLGASRPEILGGVRTLLVTMGAEGSVFYGPDGAAALVPACPAARETDPVGAGDAYRGGLLYGMERGLPLSKCGRIGAVMASFKVEGPGAQGYAPRPGEIRERYGKAFGEAFPAP